MDKYLTPKQQVFVDEYLIDFNATQSAIRAGYSKKTAYFQGPRLLKNVNVCLEIKKAMEKRSEKTRIDSEGVLRRLSEEVEADLADLYNKDGSIKSVNDWPLIWRQGLVDSFDQIGEGETQVTKLRFANRGKRLEMLGRHVDVQAFKDRVEHSADKELAEWLLKK